MLNVESLTPQLDEWDDTIFCYVLGYKVASIFILQNGALTEISSWLHLYELARLSFCSHPTFLARNLSRSAGANIPYYQSTNFTAWDVAEACNAFIKTLNIPKSKIALQAALRPRLTISITY